MSDIDSTVKCFFEARAAIFAHVGYVENYHTLSINDSRDQFWAVDVYEHVWVRFSPSCAALTYWLTAYDDEYGPYAEDLFSNEIYIQPHLPKWVYRGTEFTLVVADPLMGGTPYLQLFRNENEVKLNASAGGLNQEIAHRRAWRGTKQPHPQIPSHLRADYAGKVLSSPSLVSVLNQEIGEDIWLVECIHCARYKAPRGGVLIKGADAKDYCMSSCSGYEKWPYPAVLSAPSTKGEHEHGPVLGAVLSFPSTKGKHEHEHGPVLGAVLSSPSTNVAQMAETAKKHLTREPETSALAIYVVMGRDACDALDLIQECADSCILETLLAMLTVQGSNRTDKGLNVLFVEPVKRRLATLS